MKQKVLQISGKYEWGRNNNELRLSPNEFSGYVLLNEETEQFYGYVEEGLCNRAETLRIISGLKKKDSWCFYNCANVPNDEMYIYRFENIHRNGKVGRCILDYVDWCGQATIEVKEVEDNIEKFAAYIKRVFLNRNLRGSGGESQMLDTADRVIFLLQLFD